MGLLDIINGMQNGPGGQKQGSGNPGSGGMSPITMALIGLLAYKAMKGLGGGSNQTTPTAPTSGTGGGLGDILGGLLGGGGTSPNRPTSGGSLSDLIPGGLGGLLSGSNGGNVLSGGLGNLIKDLQNSGHGNTAQSWVGTGPNENISPDNLSKALGADTIDALTTQTGMSRDDLLSGLSQHLPGLVDQMTPHGRLPTPDEAKRMV